jgi:ferredoxin
LRRTVRVTVDSDRCCGAGQCVSNAPTIFDHDSDGVSFVVRQPDAGEVEGVRAAREACPTGAVTILED